MDTHTFSENVFIVMERESAKKSAVSDF